MKKVICFVFEALLWAVAGLLSAMALGGLCAVAFRSFMYWFEVLD